MMNQICIEHSPYRIEAEMEAEYRSKMKALESAQQEAELRLVLQQKEYESRLKVHDVNIMNVFSVTSQH